MSKPTMRYIQVAIVFAFTFAAGCEYFVSTEQRLQRAEQAAQQGDFGGAVVQLRNVLDREPKNIQARIQLVDALVKSNELEAARAALEPVIDQRSSNGAVARLVVRLHVALNEGDVLVKRLEAKELALSPAETDYAMAQAHGMLRDLNAAEREYDRALQQAGDDVATKLGASIGLAEIYASRNEVDRAFAVLQPFDSARAQRLRGLLFVRVGEAGAAVQAFESAKQQAGGELSRYEYTTLLAALIEQHIALAQLSKAGEVQEEMSRRDASSPIVTLSKAQLAYAKKEYATATTALQGLLSKQNSLTPARLLLAQTFFAQENWQQAEQHALQVMNEQPRMAEPRALLAKLYLRDGRKAKALEVIAPIDPVTISDPTLAATISKVQDSVASDPDALKEVSDWVERKPGDEAMRIAVASAYIRAHRPEQTLKLLRDDSQSASIVRVPILLAAAAMQGGNDTLKREAERLSQARAGDVRYLQVIARYFLQSRQPDAAREWLRRAAAAAPSDNSVQLEYAQMALATGETAASERVVDQVLSRDRANLGAILLKAESLAKQSKNDEALRALDAASNDFPWAVQPVLAAASLRLRSGELDGARRDLTELTKRANRASTWAAIGRAWMGVQRYSEAREALKTSVRLQPRSNAYWRSLAEVELASQQFESAQKAAKEALALNSDDILALRLQSAAEFKLGHAQDALRNAREFRKAHIDNLDAALLEADALFETKEYEAAAKLYDEVLEKVGRGQAQLASSVANAGTAVAVKAVQARRLAGMESPRLPLEQWAAKHDDAQSKVALADSYRDDGQSERAIEIYQQVLARNPNDVAALNNVALLYLEKRNPKAIDSARKAYAQQPTVPAIADTLGWVQLQMGKVADALPLLQQAAAGAEASAEIQYHYAVGLSRAGNTAKAREVLEKALSRPDTFNGRSDAEALLAQLDKGQVGK